MNKEEVHTINIDREKVFRYFIDKDLVIQILEMSPEFLGAFKKTLNIIGYRWYGSLKLDMIDWKFTGSIGFDGSIVLHKIFIDVIVEFVKTMTKTGDSL